MTTPKPCTMPEEIWAYRDEYFDHRWNRTNVVESTRYVRADLVEKIDGHGIDTTTEKS